MDAIIEDDDDDIDDDAALVLGGVDMPGVDVIAGREGVEVG